MIRRLVGVIVVAAVSSVVGISAQQGVQPMVDRDLVFQSLSVRPLPRVAAAQYAVFDSLVNAYSYFSMRQQPLWYDPEWEFLVTIKRGDQNGNEIYYRYSGDRGENWGDPIGPIQLTASDIPRYPSIVSAILPSATVNDTVFVYFFPIVVNNSWGSVQLGMAIGSAFSTQQLMGIEQQQQMYPIATASKLRIYGEGQYAIIVTQLFAPQGAPTSENNALGAILFDIFNEEAIGFVPPAWASTNFLDPQNPNSRTSTIVGIDLDDQGNLYFGAFGVFVDSENPTRPFPGVSKSTDGGETWSEFDIVPAGVLRQYAMQNGADPDSTLFTFTPKAFAVSGEDRYSFIMNCFEINADKRQQQQPELRHLVEVAKEGGQWVIRKIADISGFVISYEDTDFNQTGNEVQVARTADGSVLMAKWLDFFVYTSQDDLDGDGVTPDTVLTTDVLVSVRTANSQQWSEPINVTQSLLLDRITHIAPLLPDDLKAVPLLNVVSVPTPQETTAEAALLNAQRQLLRKQWVTVSWFDLTVSSVESKLVSRSTSLELRATMRTNQQLWVSARVPGTLPVQIDLYTLSGQHIASLYDGVVNGTHQLFYRLPNLSDGAYIVRLQTPNGSAATVVTKY